MAGGVFRKLPTITPTGADAFIQGPLTYQRRIKFASGSLESGGAASEGVGARVHDAGGSPASLAAVASAEGSRVPTASGTSASDLAAAAAEGERLAAVEGAPTAGAAAAAPAAERVHDLAGSPASPAASAEVGTSAVRTASGTPASGGADAAGSAERLAAASGSPAAGPAATSASAVVVRLALVEAAAGASATIAAASAARLASGALAALAATVDAAASLGDVVGVHLYVANVLRAAFEANVTTPEALPTLHDDAEPGELGVGPGDAWARVHVEFDENGQAGVHDLHELTGRLEVELFLPLGEGDAAGLAVADVVADAFRLSTYSDVHVGNVSLRPARRRDAWHVLPVYARWRYEVLGDALG